MREISEGTILFSALSTRITAVKNRVPDFLLLSALEKSCEHWNCLLVFILSVIAGGEDIFLSS